MDEKFLYRIWGAYNHIFFGDRLASCLIQLTPKLHYYNEPAAFTRDLIIQIKPGLALQQQCNWMLHTMVHQYLVENDLPHHHSTRPWCDAIMRLSANYFNVRFWAAPTEARKIRDGQGKRVTRRIQKRSPQGEPSISLKKIAQWPSSLGINAPLPD